MYKKISDYAIIGNLHSIALVGIDGSIDWLCLPHLDSPSVFGALLDNQKGGRFSITPTGEWDSVAAYLPNTNVLITKFRTREGTLKLTDFMPIPTGEEEELKERGHELYRLIEVVKGKVETGIIFEPRFNYARSSTTVKKHKQILIAKGNDEIITLCSSREMKVKKKRSEATWALQAGDKVWLHLNYGREDGIVLDPEQAEKSLQDTVKYWQTWLEKSETGLTVELGPFQEMVNRSALALKLLFYNPTGAIAAAATTSLPEEIGGVRNWDYRYTWIRDTSFTVQALFNLGHLTETEKYLKWIEDIPSRYGAEKMQIMYGLRGEEDLPEEELVHLEGYKGSRPVRIGNDAAKQKQLDIYGEIMDAALKLSNYVGKIDITMWPFLCRICNYVVEHWQDQDAGIWEVRGGPRHFVYSKVMCWVALDRGLIIARRYGFPAEVQKWETARNIIKEEIVEKGFHQEKKAFVQHYDTEALDATSLLIPILGFLPYDDPRVISTLEAIQRELGHEGLLYRYATEDGLPGGEGTFLLCTFWLIENLIAVGRLEEAESCLQRMKNIANHVGLFSEEYDLAWKEQLGNFPQAFTHIGYINSVISLSKAKERRREKQKGKKGPHRQLPFMGSIVLNEGEPRHDIPSKEIAMGLKNQMNILRGAYFDIMQSRVAYEQMDASKTYREYVELSYSLKEMDLDQLKTRQEKLAFWINLYNVIVIHGVIELGIKDSVKEVGNFFRRIQYNIGGMLFCPDDIEHGILRGNSRLTKSSSKLFKKKDQRLNFLITPVDPRIHFALVCASSSCPPIDVYTAENLDKELSIAGKTFLNAGGLVLDQKRNRVSLSKIFKWYGQDFGKTLAERLEFIAPYLYSKEDREFIEHNSSTIEVSYQDYDWRLNRY